MQRLDGRIVLSASDLNDFLACEHLTALELAALNGTLERPTEKPAQAELLARLGDAHEHRYIERLRADGVEVVDIGASVAAGIDRGAALRARAQATIDAMRAGAAAIYQATFFDGRWLGHADVLRRVDEASDLGAWSYEVEDTKLARSLKPYFLLQLCFYSACVERVQGRPPERMHVVLGDGTRRSFRVDEFAAYERAVKRRVEARVLDGDPGTAATYPYPVSHCSLCVWDARCSRQRRDDDSLTEVAGLTRLQERRLKAGGIATLAALGEAAAIAAPPNIEPVTFERLARQARLQLEQRNAFENRDPRPYKYELLAPGAPPAAAPPAGAPPKSEPPPELRGFALLPARSDGDLFFDIEGDPYYDVAEGLEYLFGVATPDDGFTSFWGCDRGAGPFRDRLAEKRAFERFVDFAMERRARHPDMHIYHYASYERRALQSLAQRHATREDEVDTLLREERLVDLLRVVRQSVVVGQPGYGLKKIEALFGGRERLAILAGDESVVEFERWRTARDGGGNDGIERDTILTSIEAYNRQDCISTRKLLDWLHDRRRDAQVQFDVALPFFTGTRPGEPARELKADPHAETKARLAAHVPADFDPDATAPDEAAWPFWSMLQLLDYHRREEKPEWWAFFDRCATLRDDPTALVDDGTCIVGLQLLGAPVPVRKSQAYTFTFPPQEIKIDDGTPYDPRTEKKTGSKLFVQNGAGEGTVRLERGPSFADLPFPETVVILDIVSTKQLRAALARLADALLSGAPDDGRYRAAFDLLRAAPPRLRDRPTGATLQPAVPDAAAIAALIDALDESYLFVQGPPGSGKTFQGAHAIVSLLAQGKRVGVTANSHKAINNLLAEVDRVAKERNVPFEGQRKCADPADGYVPSPGIASSIHNVTTGFDLGENGLYAGTAWAFATTDMDAALDVLFIDEAGQMALPNALAATLAARSVVLLGDPLQLPHVYHTSHPGNLGASLLEHLLGGDLRPVPPDRGVLLTRTWRMHADVCRFISELMYERQLVPVDGCNLQRVDSPGLSGTGIRTLSIDHTDARVRSEEEAAAISDQIELLLQGTVTDARGRRRALEPTDIIVVTPYNSQRRCIEAELKRRGGGCERVAVGTVDKFQGREAFVVFFSTANSSPQDAPRGVEFIFDRNRLNVAISRARALAVYVGSPALLRAVASTVERMRALSAGCLLLEYGKGAEASATPQLSLLVPS